MSEETGEKIGSRLGRYVMGDPKLGLLEQAQFLRIRVEVPINKPLRRGGWLTSSEGEKVWVHYKYKRLPSFCFRCGFLDHEDRSCLMANDEESVVQYGD